MLGAEEKAVLEGTLVANDSPDFRFIFDILIFPPSRRSSLTSRMWSAVGNSISPMTAPISVQIARSELLYFSAAGVKGYFRPRPAFFNGNVLRDPKN